MVAFFLGWESDMLMGVEKVSPLKYGIFGWYSCTLPSPTPLLHWWIATSLLGIKFGSQHRIYKRNATNLRKTYIHSIYAIYMYVHKDVIEYTSHFYLCVSFFPWCQSYRFSFCKDATCQSCRSWIFPAPCRRRALGDTHLWYDRRSPVFGWLSPPPHVTRVGSEPTWMSVNGE